MQFKISTGLKSIIGKDLITDDYVAIFELVKNSFDAYANRVDIFFAEDAIYVVDNGKGMSKDDFVNKWLFVAYSAKADRTENSDLRGDYRKNLRAKRNTFAGSKGVGRFSCDRLGSELTIQSKKYDESIINQLDVDWGEFEENQEFEFGQIDIKHKNVLEFGLPKEMSRLKDMDSGTVLKISGLRDSDSWSRKKLLELKSAIAKLIDPFGVKKDFDVYIHSPREKAKDNVNLKEWREKDKDELADESSPYLDIVNGKVRNLIFERLSTKTTRIKVSLSDDCEYISTELIDRGELVYSIREPSEFDELNNTSLSIEIYYMNTRAKSNFTKAMGVDCVQFGSVFLFNNGFRVYPIGEKSDDTLGLNTRKAQGYNRFLGTREILGLIDINGSPDKFKESSSRDQGLIKTPAYDQLHAFFMDKAIKRLEAYVANVSWKDKLDADSEDLSRILTDQGKSRVVSVIAKLVSGKNIELLDYSESLIDTVNERSSGFEETIASLQKFADKTDTPDLQEKINIAVRRYEELKQAEEESRREAETERQAREEAEEVAFEEMEARDKAEKDLEAAETALEEEKKSNLFLRKVTSLDVKSVLEFHHQIGIYSSSLKHLIDHKLDNLRFESEVSKDDYRHLLEQISFKNQQILTISRIATVADFRISAEEVEEDLIEFSSQYLKNVVVDYHPINVDWISDGKEWVSNFRPLDMMVVIENLVHNSSKSNAKARKIEFKSQVDGKNRLQIDVSDDGNGFSEHLKKDINSIFDIGVTTTDGSGLGLHHVKQVINEMGGSIEADGTYEDGAKLVIRFAK